MAPFLHVSEGKNNLIRDKQKAPVLAQNCKSAIYKQEDNQLINYKTTAIVLSLYYHPAILDIDTLLNLIAMNEQIMKKLFPAIHELVPNTPKMPIVGKETNPKFLNRSK